MEKPESGITKKWKDEKRVFETEKNNFKFQPFFSIIKKGENNMALHRGELNYMGQCFTLYTHTNKNPVDNFSYQIAEKLYPDATPQELRLAARPIKMYLLDGFDRYKTIEIKEKKNVN